LGRAAPPPPRATREGQSQISFSRPFSTRFKKVIDGQQSTAFFSNNSGEQIRFIAFTVGR
jgi:hypothetical protein